MQPDFKSCKPNLLLFAYTGAICTLRNLPYMHQALWSFWSGSLKYCQAIRSYRRLRCPGWHESRNEWEWVLVNPSNRRRRHCGIRSQSSCKTTGNENSEVRNALLMEFIVPKLHFLLSRCRPQCFHINATVARAVLS